MFTYFLMAVPFIGFVVLLDTVVLRTFVIKTKQCWLTMIILLSMTIIFDQFLTGLPIVEYDNTNNLDLRIGYAPIEDLFYTIAAVIGLGSIGKKAGIL